MPPVPFIKICCISSIEEAQAAIAAGASAIGLVSAMPSGPGVIDDLLISEIAASVAPPISTFLLTAFQDAEAIIDQHHLCRTSTIQLVDRVKPAELQKLRRHLPGIKLVQVIHVSDYDDTDHDTDYDTDYDSAELSIKEARAIATLVDALLLDSGNTKLATRELGGTGRTHDWLVSRRIRDEVNIPLFLAGGLNAANIAEAISVVRPYGLDLCSSVRTDGKLDTLKLQGFIDAVGKSNDSLNRSTP